MKLKEGLNNLKKQPNKALTFFNCEKDVNGNPVVLMGTQMPSKAEQTEVLAKAQSKKVSRGSMMMDENGNLCVQTVGSALPGLDKGVVKAAQAVSAKVFNKVIVNEKPEADHSRDVTREEAEEVETKERGGRSLPKQVGPFRRLSVVRTLLPKPAESVDSGNWGHSLSSPGPRSTW